jgi:hypothetical protein
MADEGPWERKVAQLRALRRRRRRLGCAAALGLALALLSAFSAGWDCCPLCGKQRGVISLTWPRLVLIGQEEGSTFSDALEALVHKTPARHHWRAAGRCTLLRLLWRSVPAVGSGPYGSSVDSIERDAGDALIWVAYWDPDLAVTAGQTLLATWEDGHGAGRIGVSLVAVGIHHRTDWPPALEDLNGARGLVGLQALTEAEYQRMVENRATRPVVWYGLPSLAEIAAGKGEVRHGLASDSEVRLRHRAIPLIPPAPNLVSSTVRNAGREWMHRPGRQSASRAWLGLAKTAQAELAHSTVYTRCSRHCGVRQLAVALPLGRARLGLTLARQFGRLDEVALTSRRRDVQVVVCAALVGGAGAD